MNSSTTTNFLKLLSGKLGALIFGFLVLPILSRLFLPAHFGVLQIFTAITALIVPVACLKYEFSIPLTQDDEGAITSLALCVVLAFVFSLAVLVIVLWGKSTIAALFHAPELARFLWLLPFAVFAGSMRNAIIYWASRVGRFGAIAWTELSLYLVDKLLPLLWCLLMDASVTGLFFGRLGSIGISTGLLIILLRPMLFSHFRSTPLSFAGLLKLAKQHKKFPLYSSGGTLLNTISTQLPALILGGCFTTTVLGYFAMGYNVISFPMLMLRNSIDLIFYPKAAKEYHESGSLSQVVGTFFTRLVQMGLFPMATVCFFGPILFQIVFGEQWLEAGRYAQILAVWCFLAFVDAPLRVFEIVHRQEVGLLINGVMIAGRVLGLLLGARMDSPWMALVFYVIASGCCMIGSTIWKLRVSNVSMLWVFKTIMGYTVIACALLIPLKIIVFFTNSSIVLLGSISMVTLLYGIILVKIDPSIRQFVVAISDKMGQRGSQ